MRASWALAADAHQTRLQRSSGNRRNISEPPCAIAVWRLTGIHGPKIYISLQPICHILADVRRAEPKLLRRLRVRLELALNANIHSDQGSQYGSDDWRRFCKRNHLEPSMSRRGNCWDNAVVESYFGRLKQERIKKKICKTRSIAIDDIGDSIESFYNPG